MFTVEQCISYLISWILMFPHFKKLYCYLFTKHIRVTILNEWIHMHSRTMCKCACGFICACLCACTYQGIKSVMEKRGGMGHIYRSPISKMVLRSSWQPLKNRTARKLILYSGGWPCVYLFVKVVLIREVEILHHCIRRKEIPFQWHN